MCFMLPVWCCEIPQPPVTSCHISWNFRGPQKGQVVTVSWVDMLKVQQSIGWGAEGHHLTAIFAITYFSIQYSINSLSVFVKLFLNSFETLL